MPSNEARGVIDGSLYFLLDGTRNITGPTTIINNVPLLASDVLTVRGAAGQTGDLFVLQSSAPADLITFTSDARQVSTFTLAGAASSRYATNYTLTLTGTNTQTLGGMRMSTAIASGQAAADVRGVISRVTGAGAIGYAYGFHSTVARSSATAQDEANGIYATTSHDGAGLLGFLGGVVGVNTATGPSTDNAGLYFQAANVGAANTRTYGAWVLASNTGTISGALYGTKIEVSQLSGSVANLYGLDITVTGTATSATQAIKTTGGGVDITGASLSGSTGGMLLSLAQTWNTSGTPTAIGVNITNTASNAASKLLDLQVGGTSQVKVLRSGFTGFGLGSATPAAMIDMIAPNAQFIQMGSATTDATIQRGYFQVRHYTAAQPGLSVFHANVQSSVSQILIGGGVAALNAATSIALYTASTNTTSSGSARVTIDSAGDVTFGDGTDFIFNTTTGTKHGTGATQKQSWWNATPVVQDTGWSVSNVTTDRVFDANATTLDELADVVGTLITIFKLYGLLGA